MIYYHIRLFLKRLIMGVATAWIYVKAFSRRGQASQYRKVGILFLPPLGFGDILMLSPGIAEIKRILKGSEITVITPWPRLMNIQGVDWVNPDDVQGKYDLIISPTLNLQHARRFNMGRDWLGYFSTRKLQANFPHVRGGYHDQTSHYIIRMIPILETLQKGAGEKFRSSIESESVHYPDIQTEKIDGFDLNDHERYLVAHLCNDDPDRVWDDEIMGDLIDGAARQADIMCVVLIGGECEEDRQQCERWSARLKAMGLRVYVLAGCKITQTAWLISNSFLYIGLDAGPSHIAYLKGSKVWTVFVSMNPEFRLPLMRNLKNQVIGFYPPPRPREPLFNGLLPPPQKLVEKRRRQMRRSDAEKSICSILHND